MVGVKIRLEIYVFDFRFGKEIFLFTKLSRVNNRVSLLKGEKTNIPRSISFRRTFIAALIFRVMMPFN